MNFEPFWTPEAATTFEQLETVAKKARAAREQKGKKKSSKVEGLFKQVAKTVELLLSDPRHPGLNTHPYSGLEHPHSPGEKVFEAYVQNRTPGAYRLFWCYGPEKKMITIIAITPHP